MLKSFLLRVNEKYPLFGGFHPMTDLALGKVKRNSFRTDRIAFCFCFCFFSFFFLLFLPTDYIYLALSSRDFGLEGFETKSDETWRILGSKTRPKKKKKINSCWSSKNFELSLSLSLFLSATFFGLNQKIIITGCAAFRI